MEYWSEPSISLLGSLASPAADPADLQGQLQNTRLTQDLIDKFLFSCYQ
jgi:hypothetical protein